MVVIAREHRILRRAGRVLTQWAANSVTHAHAGIAFGSNGTRMSNLFE